jgi:hypothetical protein
MKIVEILKHNPQLWQDNFKKIEKIVGKYFSYNEEEKYITEITEICGVIACIYYEIKMPHMFYILGYERHKRCDRFYICRFSTKYSSNKFCT